MKNEQMTERERQLHFALLTEKWVSRRYKNIAAELAGLLSCFLRLTPPAPPHAPPDLPSALWEAKSTPLTPRLF